MELPPSLAPEHPDYRRERYSVAQAALYLIVHVSRVYADAAAGRLGHRRDGNRRLRFSQADLDEWRTARRVEVRPQAHQVTAPRAPAPRVPTVTASLESFMPKKRRFS